MSKKPPTKSETDCLRSMCPVSSVLDILGDKWTLLVVRDMLLLGKRRYNELVDSAEGIPTNILADRLKRLEASEVIEKTPYQEKPLRYEYRLTAKGKDLLPLIKELAVWGNKYIEGTMVPPPGFLDPK
ncbi:MAG: helix-turn-helix transcriptional regulator [Sulfuriflexus sp.]|nr:helix-turn-helix transcriptional regulator [Sulfuriflexus sp.]